MASVSTVPAAKAGILALMQARSGLNGISVTWSHPGKDIPKVALFMGAARFSKEEVVALRAAPHKHDEDYVVPVWVDVLVEGNDAQGAETQMWTLVGEVEQALRADPTLNAAVGVLWGKVTGKTPQEYISDQGWACRCEIEVGVKGRN